MKHVHGGALGSVVLGCMLGPVYGHDAKALAAETTDAAGIVDALNGVFGKQTYGRAIHAKGIVLEGEFKPALSAKSLSKAAHLQGGNIPVTVRFSDFAGIPTVADTDGLATPRGMAIKFKLPDGIQTDIVAHSVNGFPSATAEDFRQLMVAIGSSGPGTPSPTPAENYMAYHPAAKAFFDNLPAPPVSFATVEYYGINSFKFVNANGDSRFGRYQLVPLAGTHFLAKADIAAAGHDYLSEELSKRVSTESVQFLIQVQLATAGDAIDNPSIAWRDSNSTIKLGTLTINRLVADSERAERALIFTPAAVTAGIVAADPMIAARNDAYVVSYGRRHASP
jgi:catalase